MGATRYAVGAWSSSRLPSSDDFSRSNLLLVLATAGGLLVMIGLFCRAGWGHDGKDFTLGEFRR